MGAKLVFGRLVDGKIRHVSEVERGAACRCTCIDCGEPLVARKGDIKEHHFAHQSGREHDWSWESSLHAFAKQLIVDAGGLSVPMHSGTVAHFGLDHTRVGASWYMKARDAVQVEAGLGAVRPDLVMTVGSQEIDLALEVRVTHWADREKLHAFRQLRLAALEIDLGRFSPHSFDVKAVRAAVLSEVENKRWLWPHPLRRTTLLPADVEPPHVKPPPQHRSEPAAAAPKPGYVPPLPSDQVITFYVHAWRVEVPVLVRRAGDDAISLKLRDFPTVGRMSSSPAEQAAPRVARLVAGVVNEYEPGLEPDSGMWRVPVHTAAYVVERLQQVKENFERAEMIKAGPQREGAAPAPDWPNAGDRVATKPPTVGVPDNPYARRRG